MTKKIKCQIELGDFEEATVTSDEMVSVMEKTTCFQHQTKKFINYVDGEMEFLVNRVVKIKPDTALLLQRCSSHLIQQHHSRKAKLRKLKEIGDIMPVIAEELIAQNNFEASDQKYFLMESILQQMQQIEKVDLKLKSKNIVDFLSNFAYCCILGKKFHQSIEIHQKAIFLFETGFDMESHYYRVLGFAIIT